MHANTPVRRFSALVLTALLCACGGQQEKQTGPTAAEKSDGSFRQEFILSFTQACLKNIPEEAAVPADLARKVCACSAEKAAETVGPIDIAKWMQGDKEVEKRVIAASAGCKEELRQALKRASGQASGTAPAPEK